MRGFARIRRSGSYLLYTSDAYGNLIPMLGDQHGILFNASFSVYF